MTPIRSIRAITPTVQPKPEPVLDPLSIYLQKIDEFKLLTPEKEVELGRKIEDGDMTAKREFVEANLRLVVWRAKSKRFQNRGVSLMDRIQEGNFGLMEALNPGRWDYRLGIRFASYARSWIDSFILQAIHHGKMIRTGVEINEDIERMNRFCSRFLTEHARFPDTREIGAELFPAYKESDADARVRHLMQTQKLGKGVSTHYRADPNGMSFGETLEDEQAQSALTTLILGEQREKIREAVLKLRPRYRAILTLRYGLADGIERTQTETAIILGLKSYQHVQQIEHKALQELRKLLPEAYADET